MLKSIESTLLLVHEPEVIFLNVYEITFLKALQQREKWTRKSKKAALWQKAHERNARRVLNVMVELEGLWVKLGQYLSTRADVLPQAYISLLKQLQDSLPPRPLEEVIVLTTILLLNKGGQEFLIHLNRNRKPSI